MSKVKLKHSNKYDEVKYFLISLVIVIIFSFVFSNQDSKTEPFDYKRAPIEDFRLNNQIISFSVKSLGNKQFNIPAPADVKSDSKLFIAYSLKGDKLNDIDTVSYNDKVIWKNPTL